MTDFVEAMPHGELREVFPETYFVTGTMKGVFGDAVWQFSRNMTVVRDRETLSIFNSVRLDDAGLAMLDALGTVRNIVRLGALHGCDDLFYCARYPDAVYWAADEMPGLDAGAARPLQVGGELPVSNASLFAFEQTKLPERILFLEREGGIAIACDALQNWVQADDYFSAETRERMSAMGFFQPANVGPVWMQMNEPGPEDFRRLAGIDFEHALCGHGEPLVGGAADKYRATFERLFDI